MVSSANRIHLSCLDTTRSLICKLNSFGPRMDLCGTPHVFISLLRSMIWSMVLNAFLRSTKMLIKYCFLSIAVNISSVNYISAIVVYCLDLKPYLLLLKILYLSVNLSNLATKNFSNILENCGSRDTGL